MPPADCIRLFRLLLPACLAVGASGCTPATDAATTMGANGHALPPFALAETDITTLQAHMARGELDSAGITRAYLQRIAATNRSGPHLHAVLEPNPTAMTEAAARDQQRRQGQRHGPLQGIPVLLTDSIGAAPMSTSTGAAALQAARPDDAYLVTRLRQAGAVVLGKANMSEWGQYRDPEARPGWSTRGGQTRNPYRLSHSPCGASSGAAVAVAANLTSVAIGIDTNGGILCPASVNGVVGLKPTVGLVSRQGVLPVSFSQDSPGPLARTVTDAATVLTAMAGRDAADPATAAMPGQAVYDYSARLRADGLRGARIGVLDSALGRQPGVHALLQAAQAELRRAGATLVVVPDLDPSVWAEDEQTLLRYEFKNGLERYLAATQAPLRTLEQIVAHDRAQPAPTQSGRGQRWLEQTVETGPLGSADYITARNHARRMAGEQGIDALLKAHQLDALLAPTAPPARPLRDGSSQDSAQGSYAAAAVAGYPALSVPMGQVDGLPVGLLFIGTAWSEPRLIELGYAYEQRTQARRPPRFDTDRLIDIDEP